MAISFSSIRSRFGRTGSISFSQMRGGAGIVNTNYSYSNYGTPMSGTDSGTIPSSGSIKMSQLDTANKASTWTTSNTPYKSSYGSNVYTSSIPFTNYFRSISYGDTFYVCAHIEASWNQAPNLTASFTYGTAKTVTSGYVANKQFFIQIIYGGGSTVQLRGYYSGSSTNYPNGTVYLYGLGEIN